MVHEARVTVRRGRDRRLAFSLIEIMIALGILTIGLVMVAAVFPVALDQHRRSSDDVMARFSMRNAQAMLEANTRYTDALPADVVGNDQRYFYAMSFLTTITGVPTDLRPRWAYFHGLGGANLRSFWPVNPTTTFWGMPVQLSWLDLIEPAPTAQSALDTRSRRFWVGFYRKLNPTISEYVVFACKRNRGEWFASQDFAALINNGDILARITQFDALLPIPWKLPMIVDGRDPTDLVGVPERVFRLDPAYTLDVTKDLRLSELVRPGSKLLSQTTGALYTVVEVIDGDDTTTDTTDDLIIKTIETPEAEGAATAAFRPSVNLWFVPGPVAPVTRAAGEMARFGESPVVDVVRY